MMPVFKSTAPSRRFSSIRWLLNSDLWPVRTCVRTSSIMFLSLPALAAGDGIACPFLLFTCGHLPGGVYKKDASDFLRHAVHGGAALVVLPMGASPDVITARL